VSTTAEKIQENLKNIMDGKRKGYDELNEDLERHSRGGNIPTIEGTLMHMKRLNIEMDLLHYIIFMVKMAIKEEGAE
jgi:hypothetical protein